MASSKRTGRGGSAGHEDPADGPEPVAASSRRRRKPLASDADRLVALFDRQRLTPSHRMIAQTLISNAAEAPYLSAEALAELAGVSQSSVSRFALAAGYKGYPALRTAIRKALSSRVHTATSHGGNWLQQAVRAEIRHLDALAESLADPVTVEQIGKAMAASRPLGVLGLRNCKPLAEHITYLAERVHPDVRAITSGDSTVVDHFEQLRSAGGTTVLTIALPRHSREIYAAVNQARSMGLSVVSIVDTAMSPIAELSDLYVHAQLGTQLIFDIPAAPLVLGLLLIQAMSNAMPASSNQRLEGFEALANDARIFP